MNPILMTDGYKTSHRRMYPENITRVYSNYTCRSTKRMPNNAKDIIVFGVQYMCKYINDLWNREFFQKDKSIVCKEAKEYLSSYLGTDYDISPFEDLHDLGYLPIKIKSLPEGAIVKEGTPIFTIVNTHPDFFWITNFLETLISTTIWKPIHSASLSHAYKKILIKYAIETDKNNIQFVDFQGHDFSFRGMQSAESAISSGLGFLTSFKGTDTIPCLQAADYYYNSKNVGFSVPASEHSVMCAHGKKEEINTLKYLMNQYPTGILSVVSDTWDLWKLITEYLSALKEDIMTRNGKLVIRPDCLDDKSQILTPQGWKYFKDLTETDLVAQVKENGTYEFVKPLKIINEPYEGDMYEIRDFHGKIDLVVTPNHRLVSYKNSNNSISIKEASEYKQNYWEYKKLRSPKSQSKGRELTSYERFLIALQADGCIKYVNKDLSTRVEFNFQKERKHDRLLEILKNTDLEYNVYFAKSRQGQSTFSVLIPYNRMVSKTFDWVDTPNLDSLWAEQFIEELKYWDSSIRNDGRFKYDTTIKENIDVVELVAIAAGKGVYISETKDNRKEHFSNIYTAHIIDNPYVGGQSITKTKIHYKGTIHCVKVPTGMILVKRNQGVCVTGNSGDPVDIICGKFRNEYAYSSYSDKFITKDVEGNVVMTPEEVQKPESKGVIELLWDIFGGTTNEQGYKVLDSHIGAIYGDSITLERAEEICKRLKDKGFASTNIVLGIGSYSMGYATRDNQGGAVKSTYVEVKVPYNSDAPWVGDKEYNIEGREIFKDPITDDGTKKSAKGLLCVKEIMTADGLGKLHHSSYQMIDQCTPEQEEEGALLTVFLDGKLVKEYTLEEIRERIKRNLYE